MIDLEAALRLADEAEAPPFNLATAEGDADWIFVRRSYTRPVFTIEDESEESTNS